MSLNNYLNEYYENLENDKVEIFNGLDAPDHGELWSESWKITKKMEDGLCVTL